ncbi:MAG: sulfur carrier protein ThiS [Bacteroidales bacterium]|nr:sulfur carrier protein ThiS [Bacteroidales bacterium]
MEIILNNRPESIDGYNKITVKELLELKNFTYKMLMVRLNDTTIKRDEYENTFIKEGDKVAVIHLMTGG